MYGQYDNALLMNKQNGISLHLEGDYLNLAGFRLGAQSTQINLNPVYGLSTASQQNQENYLLSLYVNDDYEMIPGRWTFKLDAHQIKNNSSNNFSNVSSLAPQIKWLSNSQKIQIDWSYANSSYVNIKPIHQVSMGITYAANDDRSLISTRIYRIRNLDPLIASGNDSLVSTEVRLTHLLGFSEPGLPFAISFGVERGRKIFNVDMTTQVLYNLPMMQVGGETISATWKIDTQSNVTLFAGRSRYLFSPTPAVENNFRLTTFSAQLKTTW